MKIDTVLKAISDEPELEDEMPEAMWTFVKESKENATIALRHVVKLTKDGIKERVLKEATK
jgi:hypothetical protein